MPVADQAAVERHPHLAEPLPPDWVRVDLHTHTMWSGDSTTTPDELERAIVSAGIDVICITDHNTISGATELAGRLPCRVVVGSEVRTNAGELIGLFLTERLPVGESPAATARIVRDQGGLVYVPHPFDPMRRHLTEEALFALCDAGMVDVVETRNAKTALDSLNCRAAGFAEERGIAGGAGSDAHVPDAIGAAYVELPDFDGPADFHAKLPAGRIVGHHWDQARPWSARIVPSTAR